MFKLKSKPMETRRPVPAAKSPSVEPDGIVLFEALVCEFHWTALQIAGICQIFSGALARKESWILRSSRILLPAEAAVVRAALAISQELGVSNHVSKSLTRIYFNLTDAKGRTELILTDSTALSDFGTQLRRIEQLSAMWLQLAGDCLAVVQELEPETRWRLSCNYSENAIVLSKLLRSSIAGEFGCLDLLGNINLPVLPQRRREPRVVMLQPCWVHVRNRSVQGTARDISRNGIGLNCRGDFRLRDLVCVELRNGRRFNGRVVWIKDDRLGIQLSAPLEQSDPLLAG